VLSTSRFRVSVLSESKLTVPRVNKISDDPIPFRSAADAGYQIRVLALFLSNPKGTPRYKPSFSEISTFTSTKLSFSRIISKKVFKSEKKLWSTRA
jgi:hypothetical protein